MDDVEHDLEEVLRVGAHRFAVDLLDDLHPLRRLGGDHLHHQRNHFRELDRGRPVAALLAPEEQQLPGDRGHALHALLDVAQERDQRPVFGQPLAQQRDISAKEVERVVHLVRHSGHHPAQRHHLLALHQRGFGFLQPIERLAQLGRLCPQAEVQLDARAKLLRVERLLHVVVGARLEAGQLGGHLLAGGEEDDGDLGGALAGAHLPRQRDSVHARHHDVGNDQVGRLGQRGSQRGRAVGERLDAVPAAQLLGQVGEQVDVVLHHRDAGPFRGSGLRRRCRHCHLQRQVARIGSGRGRDHRRQGDGGERLGVRGRKVHLEGRALARLALHGNPSAVQRDQLLDDGEADPGAFETPGRRRLHLHEALEDLVQVLLLDADSLVDDAHPDSFAVAVHRHRHQAARERELAGVRYQVEHDPLQMPLVADPDVLAPRRDFNAEPEVERLGVRLRFFDDPPDGRGDVDRHAGQRRLSRLQLGEQQEVVDQLEQPRRVALDGFHHVALGGLERAVPRQRCGRREDQRQRRAQLVADVGEELALQPVELAQALVGGLQIQAALDLAQEEVGDHRVADAGDHRRVDQQHQAGDEVVAAELRFSAEGDRHVPEREQPGGDQHGDQRRWIEQRDAERDHVVGKDEVALHPAGEDQVGRFGEVADHRRQQQEGQPGPAVEDALLQADQQENDEEVGARGRRGPLRHLVGEERGVVDQDGEGNDRQRHPAGGPGA